MGVDRQNYLDSLLSPTFFTEQFKGTFGIITFYLEKIGVYFACFLFIKFLTEVFVTIIRAFEIHRISNKTMGFWKILFGAIYNLCILSFFTPVFSSKTTPSAPQNTNQFLPLSNHQPYSTIEKKYKRVEDQPRKLKLMSIVILKITNQRTHVLSHINYNHKMMLPFKVWWYLLRTVTKTKNHPFL